MSKRALVLAFAICCLSVRALSQTAAPPTPAPLPKPKPEHFRAVASFPRTATNTAWADIRITRYSSDATTKRLAALLVEGGQNMLVKELEKLKPIGKASLSQRVGFFDLKLIRSRKTPTGRRIIAVSDRPINFLEAYNSGRSMDYELGIVVMDLKMNAKGKEVGQGLLIYAAKVKINKKGKLEIEYLGVDPMNLKHVQKY
ncbi:MAG TPA: hypothetical protein VGJ55_08565 [Pyrinomonadaceae bacterium]|jgi:hypothetical protein